MKVGEQIKQRMAALKVSARELSERVDVSDQTVRYWLSGRNLPGKGVARKVEDALSFQIDWTERGTLVSSVEAPPQNLATALDVELFLKLQRLPASTKLLLSQLIDEIMRQSTIK